MKLLSMILIVLATGTSFAASAAQSTANFRVGITIEHECNVHRTPDGGEVSLACEAPTASATRSLPATRAWPRANRRTGASTLREVSGSDRMRLIVVEY